MNDKTDKVTKESPNQHLKKPTLIQVLGSVLSAIFGVQSSKNRERDFSKGDPKQFIAVYIGIIITIVILMIIFVNIVISSFAT